MGPRVFCSPHRITLPLFLPVSLCSLGSCYISFLFLFQYTESFCHRVFVHADSTSIFLLLIHLSHSHLNGNPSKRLTQMPTPPYSMAFCHIPYIIFLYALSKSCVCVCCTDTYPESFLSMLSQHLSFNLSSVS